MYHYCITYLRNSLLLIIHYNIILQNQLIIFHWCNYYYYYYYCCKTLYLTNSLLLLLIIIIKILSCCCCLFNQRDWSKQSSLCKFNPYNRVPLLPVSTLFFLWANSKQPPHSLPLSFSTSSFLLGSRSLTGSSAVTADVVTRHPLDLTQDGLGQLLHNVVLANMMITLKGIVERLLLAVLQHWDPSEKRREA